MIVEGRPPNKEIIIDLRGPDGNAFALLGLVKNLGNQLGIDTEPIIKEMMKGDYENLVNVLDENFGNFVTLYK